MCIYIYTHINAPMCFNNSNLPRSAQIPPWRLQPVGKTWRNAHRSLEGLSIASFHFSQHPGAEQITPSENLLSSQTCCLSGLFMLCSQNQPKNDARHLCRCICTLFSGSLFLNHKQTFKPCVPKKDIIKPCTQKTTEVHEFLQLNGFFSTHALSVLLGHLSWEKCAKSVDFQGKSGQKNMAFEVWQCSPPSDQKFNFRTCEGGVGSASSRQPPSRSAVSWGTAIRPANQINLEQWLISQPPWLSTSLQNRCPQSHQSRTWWVYRWFNPKKWHQRILNVNFEGNFRYCFASGFP